MDLARARYLVSPAGKSALASLPVGQVGKALPWFEAVAGGLVAAIALSLLLHNFQAV